MNYYFDDYTNMLQEALSNVDRDSIDCMMEKFINITGIGAPILVCGNGGSAAITEHMSCDHTKGVAMATHLRPFFIPIQSNVSMLTAIANDISYEEVFSKQIEWFPNKKAGVLVVSSSGSSPNIVKALKIAKQFNMPTMAMVGFQGGTVLKDNLAETVIHVKSNNYGIVEDCHQIIMHSMSQEIILMEKMIEG